MSLQTPEDIGSWCTICGDIGVKSPGQPLGLKCQAQYLISEIQSSSICSGWKYMLFSAQAPQERSQTQSGNYWLGKGPVEDLFLNQRSFLKLALGTFVYQL